MLDLHIPADLRDTPAPDLIRLRVLSLGAGVQSTELALIAALGEAGPMPIVDSQPASSIAACLKLPLSAAAIALRIYNPAQQPD